MTTDPIIAELQRIVEAAEGACVAALADKSIKGAINWGDLHCHEARRYINQRGEIGIEVHIEEASESAYELQQFIGEFLRKEGISGVEVHTEW